ncbi:unnamed protein product [Brassica napus]|uniref:(rape) hypothetical protein n=1 Tax=Brassica napus TaxID=3708 RepID=A0A816HY11_BRANA|nr:unnamed protein product [Brassica napus]
MEELPVFFFCSFAVGRSASETGIRGVEKLNIANDESILLCWKWFPVVLYRSDSVECTADMERVLRPSPSSHREVIVFDRRQILRHIFSSLSPSGRYDGIRRRWKRGSFLEASTDRERYLSDLIQERQKLASLSDLDIYEPGSPFRSLGPALTNGKLHFELATHCRVFTLLKVQFLESLLKPVDKREQLKELGALNGTLREESPSLRLSPTASVPRLENKDFYRRDERLQFICFLVIKFILYF